MLLDSKLQIDLDILTKLKKDQIKETNILSKPNVAYFSMALVDS